MGQRWRVFSLHDADSMVQVAQPLAQRFDLAESLILSAMTPLIISIPLLAMIIGLIVTRALKPLTSLAERLRATRVEELGEIDSAYVPGELKPVVDTINRLFARVDEAFTREKRFASDAAHELRTPLSILRITAHNISVMQSPPPELIQALQAGVERMSHVVDQILLLNRTNPEHFTKRLLPLRIDKLAQDVIADMFEQIDGKQQSIELQASETTVAGDEFTLRTLLQNLIGNASKYTPAGGNILVNIVNQGRQVALSVEDSGSGISPDERQRALQRFYRIGGDRHTSDTEGCGLGLSIVQQIAQLHGAQFELDDSEVLGGLAARVVFKGHPA
ncbi:ATP-binding protein [Pseudobowmanella zhangzhouensis]|uniref:ATP-binding protein n=1 Tax=Pseudobowmanella zhangzhouensis TaxID=1537679 RepID=UPI0036106D41